MTPPPSNRPGAAAALFVRRHFLWLLIGCYIFAVVWPTPGIAIRSWQWSSQQISNVPLASLLLLAVMLFIAAALVDLEQLRTVGRNPLIVLAALAAVWFGPAALSMVFGRVLPTNIGGEPTAGLLVSFALIASMPVANSSVGWTQSAGGNLGLALAMVVISIVLSPMITPGLIRILGATVGESERECAELVGQFSGLFFIVWVILPTAAGFASRLLLTPERVEATRPILTLVSAAALLVLNYINSVLALPRVSSAPLAILATTLLLATSLAAIGIALGWLIARAFGLRPETRTALMFGLSMKHTGLALILAGTVLSDQPVAILLIVLATLMQHILAGVVQWWMDRTLTTP